MQHFSNNELQSITGLLYSSIIQTSVYNHTAYTTKLYTGFYIYIYKEDTDNMISLVLMVLTIHVEMSVIYLKLPKEQTLCR